MSSLLSPSDFPSLDPSRQKPPDPPFFLSTTQPNLVPLHHQSASTPSRELSFKDKLLGSFGSPLGLGNSMSTMDCEEEVYSDPESEDDSPPRVRLSAAIKKRIRSPWRNCLIIKVFGKSYGYKSLLRRLHGIWRPQGPLSLVDLGYDYYLVRLSNHADYSHSLEDGPWFVGEHYLSVRRWEPEFKPSSAQISFVAVWARVPELPIEFFDPGILQQIGILLGQPIRIDTATSTMARGRYARICVQIDITQPLVHHILIGSFRQTVTYENLPSFCFSCGRVGHVKDHCPQSTSTVTSTTQDSSVDVTSEQSPHPPVVTTDTYGPWMLVTRRRSKNRPNPTGQPSKNSTPVQGSSSKTTVPSDTGPSSAFSSLPISRPNKISTSQPPTWHPKSVPNHSKANRTPHDTTNAAPRHESSGILSSPPETTSLPLPTIRSDQGSHKISTTLQPLIDSPMTNHHVLHSQKPPMQHRPVYNTESTSKILPPSSPTASLALVSSSASSSILSPPSSQPISTDGQLRRLPLRPDSSPLPIRPFRQQLLIHSEPHFPCHSSSRSRPSCTITPLESEDLDAAHSTLSIPSTELAKLDATTNTFSLSPINNPLSSPTTFTTGSAARDPPPSPSSPHPSCTLDVSFPLTSPVSRDPPDDPSILVSLFSPDDAMDWNPATGNLSLGDSSLSRPSPSESQFTPSAILLSTLSGLPTDPTSPPSSITYTLLPPSRPGPHRCSHRNRPRPSYGSKALSENVNLVVSLPTIRKHMKTELVNSCANQNNTAVKGQFGLTQPSHNKWDCNCK
ncbi:hypothetical protein L1049_008356 [Liquidambar formosana]|uniref:CCHC-type domain-containing protein n=1 Tax=Liquidambar formosana TaxID=63359 RepID=A0AAP0S3I8_LIQFO